MSAERKLCPIILASRVTWVVLVAVLSGLWLAANVWPIPTRDFLGWITSQGWFYVPMTAMGIACVFGCIPIIGFLAMAFKRD